MKIIWYNRAYCNSCSEYIWTEYSEHHITCVGGHVELEGTELLTNSGSINHEDFITAVEEAYSEAETLTIQQWQ